MNRVIYALTEREIVENNIGVKNLLELMGLVLGT